MDCSLNIAIVNMTVVVMQRLRVSITNDTISTFRTTANKKHELFAVT